MSKLCLNYGLFDPPYTDDFPTKQYYLEIFKTIPSIYNDNDIYDKNVINHFLKDNFHLESVIDRSYRTNDRTIKYLLVNKEKSCIIVIHSTTRFHSEFKIDVYYDIKMTELNEIIDFEQIKIYKKIKNKSNISLIKNESGILDIEEYFLSIPEVNVGMNYGSKFIKIHETIINRLNKNYDKGIILLHGDPGTGKTTYIKYLTGQITGKEILFIPPSMAETLSDPSIIPFLMEHKNSILIIEDGERVISDREINGSIAGVSNILNLTDGILGDCLNIQIIVTFNMKREKIDNALLRKGRLIAEHKFEKLTVDETNTLLKHLDKNITVNEGMVLADIYNIDTDVYKTDIKNKIGFK